MAVVKKKDQSVEESEKIDPELKEPFKVGRKSLGDEKRNIKVLVSFNEVEYTKLKELRDLTNIRDIAPYCRAKSLENTKLIYAPPKYILEYKSEIRKVGINLNQLLKLIPIKYPLLNLPIIHEDLKEMKESLDKLLALANKKEQV